MDTDPFLLSGSPSANGSLSANGTASHVASTLSPDAEDLLRRLRAGELVPPPPIEPGEPTGGGTGRRRLRDVLAERLPVGVRGAHLDPAMRGALGLGLVALVAALAALGLAWRSAPQPVAAAVPVVSPAALPAAATASGPAAPPSVVSSPGAGTAVVVDVAGKVRHPGVVTLRSGARVADALTQAGGVLPGTDTSALSLARKVADGEQILVTGKPGTAQPATTDPSSTATTTGSSDPSAAGGSGAPVDLNAATVDQLDALPGVGPVLAGRIIEYRTAHGGFKTTDELKQVKGLGGKTGEELLPLVHVG